MARDCEGFSRRDFIKVGSAGLLGLTLPQILKLESEARAEPRDKASAQPKAGVAAAIAIQALHADGAVCSRSGNEDALIGLEREGVIGDIAGADIENSLSAAAETAVESTVGIEACDQKTSKGAAAHKSSRGQDLAVGLNDQAADIRI